MKKQLLLVLTCFTIMSSLTGCSGNKRDMAEEAYDMLSQNYNSSYFDDMDYSATISTYQDGEINDVYNFVRDNETIKINENGKSSTYYYYLGHCYEVAENEKYANIIFGLSTADIYLRHAYDESFYELSDYDDDDFNIDFTKSKDGYNLCFEYNADGYIYNVQFDEAMHFNKVILTSITNKDMIATIENINISDQTIEIPESLIEAATRS